MALLSNEARQNLKPFINGFVSLLAVCVVVSLVCRFVLGGWPVYVEWLKPLSDFVIILGAIVTGLLIADRNKLVK